MSYETLVFIERIWLDVVIIALLIGLFLFTALAYKKLTIPCGIILIFLLCWRGNDIRTSYWLTKLGTEDEILAVDAYKNHFAHQDFESLVKYYNAAKNSNEQCWVGIAMCHVNFLEAKRFFEDKKIDAPFCKIGDSELSDLAIDTGDLNRLSSEEFCKIAYLISQRLAVKHRQSIENENFDVEQ